MIKRQMKDVDGKPLPGWTVKSSKVMKWPSVVVKDLFMICFIIACVVGLFWLSVLLFQVSLNWIFNTELFTFWKTALLMFLLSFVANSTRRKGV